MGSKKLLTTLLATGLAQAVAQDEKAEGFDLSAGMFGPAVSEWLRSTAVVIHEAQTGAKPIGMVPDTLCHKLQQQCSDWGVYWRAPDSHGVKLNREQALVLLERALGVEVEIATEPQIGAKPIDMVLHCPQCHKQHIDAPDTYGDEVEGLWDNPPHRSHQCHHCRFVWRPADVPTNGVAAVKTKGKNDSPITGEAS